MAQLRSVNTKFWEDPWVENLTSYEKYLFLYLLTCGNANIAGVYEITIKRIAFETGLNVETIRNALERFANDKKAYFVNDNYIFLPNWLKNQNINTNMKLGVLKIFRSLPISVLITILGNDYQTILNDYQTLSNVLLNINIEYKYRSIEDELKEESIHQPVYDPNKKPKISPKPKESKKEIPTFEEFFSYILENDKTVNKDSANLKYKSWVENGWKDGNDRAIKNWKSKILNTIQYLQKDTQPGQPKKHQLSPQEWEKFNGQNKTRADMGKTLLTVEQFLEMGK